MFCSVPCPAKSLCDKSIVGREKGAANVHALTHAHTQTRTYTRTHKHTRTLTHKHRLTLNGLSGRHVIFT
jgi:hypothetical protein